MKTPNHGWLNMLDWYETLVEKSFHRVRFALMTRLHPDLARLVDEKDRRWAMWFAGSGSPAWQRYLGIIITTVIGPILVTVSALIILSAVTRSLQSSWIFICMLTWLLGIVVSGACVEMVRGRKVKNRCFQAMRIFGEDVCHMCGYNMVGHNSIERRCPECGHFVPKLRERKAA